MEHYSLSVQLPQNPPFDRPETQPGNWYDSFLGNLVLPAYETGHLQRFWFSHYGMFGKDAHAKFRFSTDQFEAINAILEPLIKTHSLTLLPEHEKTYPHQFDIIGDLVPPHEKSHYGENARNTNRLERGEVLYSFLHASAVMVLHCLSKKDADGRWYREFNPDFGNTEFNDTMESIHHLFCNSTNPPTGVCVLPVAGHIGPPFELLSPLYAKINNKYTKGTQVVRVVY